MVSSRPVTNLDDFFSEAVNSTLHVNSKLNKNIVTKMLKESRSKDQLVNRLEEMERRELQFHKNMLRQKERERLSLPVILDPAESQLGFKTNLDFWNIEKDIQDRVDLEEKREKQRKLKELNAKKNKKIQDEMRRKELQFHEKQKKHKPTILGAAAESTRNINEITE